MNLDDKYEIVTNETDENSIKMSISDLESTTE